MPKEATCDVECAMKVESLRIFSKKRKQSQRTDSGGGAPSNGKGVKRSLSSCAKPGECPENASCVSSPDCCPESSGGGEAASIGTSKESREAARRRFVWSVPLHQDFVAAVFDIGLKCASPKLLLEMMPVVDGLTSEHIKSHLQKYRLHRQRSREEFLKSYGYLTDLDGAKGLGGGSAAATIKAAAAAAGDMKGSTGPSMSDSGAEEGGCAASCDCHDSPGAADGGGAVVDSGSLDDERKASPAVSDMMTEGSKESKIRASVTSGIRAGEDAEGVGGESSRRADTNAGTQREVGSGTLHETLQEQASGGRVQEMTGALLQSHLALLARGIDMQIKFHQHIREVVESQRTLQVQLLGKQGGEPPPSPSRATNTAGARAATSEKEATSPARLELAEGNQQTNDARVQETPELPRQSGMVGVVRSEWEGYRNIREAQQAAAAMDSRTVVGESEKASTALTSAPRARQAAEVTRHRATPSSLPPFPPTGAGMNKGRSLPAATDAPAAAAAGNVMGPHGPPSTQRKGLDHPDTRGNPAQQVDASFGYNPMRMAYSVRSGAGGITMPHNALPMGRHGVSIAPRSYVPGEYTLISKSPGTGTTGASSHVSGPPASSLGLRGGRTEGGGDGGAGGAGGGGRGGVRGGIAAAAGGGGGVVGGANAGAMTMRGPGEARTALTAAGLAPGIATGVAGQETLALQRHMQAQMEMQRTMLEACVDQANNFGVQRAWQGAASGAGGALGSFGEAVALTGLPVPNSGRGIGGAGGAGTGDGAGAGSVGGSGEKTAVGGGRNKEHRPDALPSNPSDSGDPSALMGLLQQDDVFDFNWLDRSGEVKAADNANAPARPLGEEQSLFSFLLE